MVIPDKKIYSDWGKVALVAALFFVAIATLALCAQILPQCKGLDFVRDIFQNSTGLITGSATLGTVGLALGALGLYLHKKPKDPQQVEEIIDEFLEIEDGSLPTTAVVAAPPPQSVLKSISIPLYIEDKECQFTLTAQGPEPLLSKALGSFRSQVVEKTKDLKCPTNEEGNTIFIDDLAQSLREVQNALKVSQPEITDWKIHFFFPQVGSLTIDTKSSQVNYWTDNSKVTYVMKSEVKS